MSTICCMNCYDGNTDHCDGCNLYNLSNHIEDVLNYKAALDLACDIISHGDDFEEYDSEVIKKNLLNRVRERE